MKNKLWSALAALMLIWLLTAPAMAEMVDTVPYPPRTFLYIVDCSGSMADYQEVLNVGRQMLLDLLPPENTIVIAFAEAPRDVTDSLEFGGGTSVLAGIRAADKILEELWTDNPEQEVTAVLFSDMYSTVQADNNTVTLVKDEDETSVYSLENKELIDIASRWTDYVWGGKLRYYSLNWPYDSSEEMSKGVHIQFPVPPPPSENGNLFPSTVPGNADILKTCVEVYAGVLTGRSSGGWKSAASTWTDEVLTVALDERYREFLFLDEVPRRAVGPGGEELKSWSLPDGCLLLVEGGVEGICSIEGTSANAEILSFTIPQPKLEVNFSADPMSIYDLTTISVAVTDGRNYFGYDDSNSVCFLDVTAPGESTPWVLSSSYNSLKNSHEFTYTPETLGKHEFRITYMVLGAEQIVRELVYAKDSVCTPPVPNVQQMREYSALSQKLLNLEKGKEIQFTLSNYYEKQHVRLEYVVEAPEDDTIAVWEVTAEGIGTVTVQGCGNGNTVLHYTINCYLDGEDMPCYSVEYELPISVKAPPKPLLNIAVMAVASVLVVLLFVIVVVRARKRNT